MKKTINVVCAADDHYAPLCGIMLTSLFETNHDCHVEAYVLTSGFSRRNTLRLQGMAERGGYDARVNVCVVDESLFDGCPIRKGDHVRLAAYYRFLVADLLPADMQRVIYLDCDILVRGSLLPLFETPMDGAALAACVETYDPQYVENSRRLGYPSEHGYFNSGVLLIHLDYWRRHGVGRRLFQYVADDPDRCLWHDQDALNGVLHDRKVVLPMKYNFYSYYLHKGFLAPEVLREYLEESPVVVHYCVPGKPWDWYVPDYPFRKEWERSRRLSPWKLWGGLSHGTSACAAG